ncbi:hypothetical protein [Asticcacaulis sp. AC402]|uniref:hypothetical protein n=1 Tax=Asticcacaulis sp. AC402 TaxID=1282361 RepID=UPI0003C3FF8C|nr:hypothetical protein [Asticcacaulis sp. AC402]ESQ75358.1 hypothetical protein ABAC402_09645 [Asticcacaulis sp. AC402]
MSEAFHIAEYNNLKAEILLKMRQVDDSFRFMLIAVAATMTWVVSNYKTFNDGLYVILFFVPLFISVSFTLYLIGLNKSVLWRTAYIRELERRYGDDSHGWESSPQHQRFAAKRTSYATARGLIYALNLLTLLFAGYMLVENTTIVEQVRALARI